MIYKNFADLQLSALGMGCMRLPTLPDGTVDLDTTMAMVDDAMANGVNYYDTAWGYHNGQSEVAMGKALGRYPRESYYLADKFPGYDLSNMGKVEEIFAEQLKRTGAGYFDFYLVHNVCEVNIEQYLDDAQYGSVSYLKEMKRQGLIRHLGFSAHGSCTVMRRFLEAYGDDMEFCQIQLNWVDWTLQSAKEKMELLREYHLPVWVMEPLRGGRLAKLSDEDTAKLKAARPDETVPAWSFRFLQSIGDVVVTLSGMSNPEQMKENLATYAEDKPLAKDECALLLGMAKDMVKGVPCTACRYCTEHCPMELDIPQLIELYNEQVFSGGGYVPDMVLSTLDEDKRPSACLGCGACQAVCPQQIEIPDILADFAKRTGK